MTDINQLSTWNLEISRAIAALGTEGFFPALVKAIRETGKTPVQRNTFYEPVREWTAETPEATGDSAPPEILDDNLATA